MKFSLKVILVSAIILIAVIPAAYGNGGTWESVGGGAVQINGVTDIDQTDTYTDTATGNHVDIKAIVDNGIDAYFDTAGIFKNSENGALEVDYTLSSGLADYIKCAQKAYNAVGDTASASTEIEHGTLSGYYGKANADEYEASVSQEFDDAGGEKVSITELGSNNQGKAVTSTTISNGYIAYYNGYADADSEFISASHNFEFAEGDKIELKNTIFAPYGKASVTTVATGSWEDDETAYIFGYGSGAGIVDPTEFPVSLGPVLAAQGYDEIGGQKINIDSAVFNSAGYKASVSAEILNGAVGSAGFIFTDFATLYPDTSLVAATGTFFLGPDWAYTENIKLTSQAQTSPKVKYSDAFEGSIDGDIFLNMAGVGLEAEPGTPWAYTVPDD